MTQLACKCYQKRKETTEICKENFIDFLRLQLEDVKEHADDGKQFYNHFLHMFRIDQSKMCEVFHQQSWNIQKFLSNKGFFQEAIKILDVIQNYSTKSYGAENKITLDTKINIASCLNRMGKYNEALEIYYQVGKIQTDILGINQPSTLDTKNKTANYLNRMGKYNEALEIYYQVGKIQTDILGINHLSTLDTKNNTANCLNRMGKYNEALEIYYQVGKIQTDILGINHTSTLEEEAKGAQMEEFIVLRSKLYSFKVHGEEKKKCKGVKKNVVVKSITQKDYKDCLFNDNDYLRTMIVIRSHRHEIYTEEVNKVH